MNSADTAYAQALFRAAGLSDKLSLIAEELRQLEPLILKHRHFFFNAGVPAARQSEVLRECLDGQADVMTAQFLQLLCTRNRLRRLPMIRQRFDALCAEALHELTVRLRMPYQPDEALLTKMRDALGRMDLFPYEHRDRIQFTVEPDESLIGGFVAECDGRVLDASFRTVLLNLIRN